jgi:glutaconate CoA-transferase subunit A
MAARYVAAASGLPFGVLRGYTGTDLPRHSADIAPLTCPFTGDTLAAVRALHPDVTVVHAQQADRRGNVGMWGIIGVQKEAVLAARRSLVTVEEVVDALDPRCTVVLPSWVVSAVAAVPRGAHPSYAHDYYDRDNRFYGRWDAISRDRDAFAGWLDRHVLSTSDFAGHLRLLDEEDPVGSGRLAGEPA